MDPITIKSPQDIADGMNRMVVDLQALRKDLDEGRKTQAEFKDGVDKRLADYTELAKAVQTLQQSRQAQLPADGSLAEIAKDFSLKIDGEQAEFRGKQLADAFLKSRPAPAGSDLERYQVISDAVSMWPKRFQMRRDTWWRRELNAIQAKYLGKVGGAMDTGTADEGTEWVPSQVMSSQLVDIVREAGRVAGAFNRIPLSSKVNMIPRLEADGNTYVMTESTVDPATTWNRITHGAATTGQISMTPIKICRRTVTSVELIEDMTFDMMVWLRNHVGLTIAEKIDDCIINGDITSTTATHFDTGRTITGSTDPLVAAWDGLRYVGHNTTGLKYDMGGATSFTMGEIAYALGQMGKWGNPTTQGGGAVFLCSFLTNALLAATGATYTSYTGMGNSAPICSGAVGNVLGVEVVPTGWYPVNESATGVSDGTTTSVFTGGVFAARNYWLLGDRRQITVRTSDELYLESDQVVAVATWRGVFTPAFTPSLASYPIVMKVYDCKTI